MSQEAIGNDVSAEQGASEAATADLENQNIDTGDGGDADDGGQGGGAISERDRRLADIRRRRQEHEALEREQAQEQGLAVTAGDAPAGDDEGAGEQAGAQSAPALPPGVELKDGKWFARMKVDGQDALVPFEQAFRDGQKLHAADVRLREANRLLKDAQEQSQRIVAEAQAAQQGKQPSPVGDAEGGEIDEADLDEIAKELETGDIRKAVKMLAKAQGRTATPAAATAGKTDEQVRAIVSEALEQERIVGAYGRYRSRHADLASDPVLNDMVDRATVLVMQDPEFAGKSHDEIFDEAAARTRKTLNQHAGRNENARPTREQRKLAVATPGPGRAATKPQPAPPQPKDPRSIVNDMKALRSRGR